MHNDAPRVNGGIGFSIDGPSAQVDARASVQPVILVTRDFPMTEDERQQLVRAVEGFTHRYGIYRHAEIRISGAMRTHVGMGSGTALRLGALEALAHLNGLPVTQAELVAASGRGGTSGVGINSYFSGGLICDLGRANDAQRFLPSSAAPSARQPLAFPAVALPAWPMLLCLPRSIAAMTQAEELGFFERTAPLPQSVSLEACYVALFELYAAAVEGNYVTFCQGIKHMQATAWKRAERAEHGPMLETIAAALGSAGADCVGMSSLGPMLFCFAGATQLPSLRRIAEALGCTVFETQPENRGREVRSSDA